MSIVVGVGVGLVVVAAAPFADIDPPSPPGPRGGGGGPCRRTRARRTSLDSNPRREALEVMPLTTALHHCTTGVPPSGRRGPDTVRQAPAAVGLSPPGDRGSAGTQGTGQGVV